MGRDTILIVDDMEINRTILCGLFKDEYHLLEAENGEQAMLLLKQYHSSIAIMLLDIVMPEKDGYQVLEEMNENGLLSEVPVVVITADGSLEGELKAFDLGASDIIAKPFEPHVVKRRVHNIVELYLHRHNLEELVDEQAAKLRESNDVLIDALSSVIEYRSLESGQHIKRIRVLTKTLLEEVRQNCPEYGLNEHKINTIAAASVMHDIGKIAIPDNILNKPGRLTDEEFEIMKGHSVKGCEILMTLTRMDDKEYLQYAYNICRYHHERWDGGGYPDGLAGDAIPICAQATGIVDAYDALTSDRVYKKAIPHEQAVSMIFGGQCGAFSPKILACFDNVKEQLALLVKRYADGKLPEEDAVVAGGPSEIFREDHISAFEKEQLKYYAMLRYADNLAVEVDLAANSWKLVYHSGLKTPEVREGEGLDTALETYMEQIVHPDDRAEADRIWRKDFPVFFAEGRFRQSWHHRIWDKEKGRWQMVEMTLLRVDTERLQQKKGLILWAPVKGWPEEPTLVESACENAIFHSIFHGSRQLRNDKWLSILQIEDGFLGYSREEIRESFSDHYIELIHPEDRQSVMRKLKQQLKKGSDYEIECRVIDAKGQAIWMLSKGRAVVDSQGQEILYEVMVNIASFKKMEEEFQQSLERYKIILDQTDEILFEWDVDTDCVDFSSNWKDKFGYEPIRRNFSERITRASHLHPDDMKAFGQYLEAMKNGMRSNVVEFRISDAKGRYKWTRIRATVQFDSKGKPRKVIGLVGDINEEKLAAQELKAKAERDILTRLYNRESARIQIEQRLDGIDGEDSCALFIIDLDNFKQINDRYGHMFGDAVLKRTAEQLSQTFRSSDVLSRIGGDEFMVLFQGVANREHIEAIAERVIANFKKSFETLPSDCHVSCSIGISMAPKDGRDYEQLFRKADLALYHAKDFGKKQVCFYDDSMESRNFAPPELPAREGSEREEECI